MASRDCQLVSIRGLRRFRCVGKRHYLEAHQHAVDLVEHFVDVDVVGPLAVEDGVADAAVLLQCQPNMLSTTLPPGHWHEPWRCWDAK